MPKSAKYAGVMHANPLGQREGLGGGPSPPSAAIDEKLGPYFALGTFLFENVLESISGENLFRAEVGKSCNRRTRCTMHFVARDWSPSLLHAFFS
jgi:hypothetical protein